MKKAVFVIIFLTIVGVAASLWLIPGASELALMNLRDKKYDEAMAAYQGQVSSGKLTPEVAGRSVDLYLKSGKIDDAIKVMEQFVAENPQNVSALERLGTLYQYAQRPDDYMKNLERIDKLAPSDKNQQILNNLYAAKGDHTKQLDIMTAMVESNKAHSPDYYRDIANLQAAQKSYPNAIATLRAFKQQYPHDFGFAQAELLTSLLLDDHKPDEALAVAQDWAGHKPPPEEIARLTNVLHYKGAPTQALAFIEHYKEQAKTNTDLLTELASVYVTLHRNDEAFALLDELHQKKKLPPVLFGSYIELLVARGDTNAVEAFVEEIDPQVLTESQAVFLVELAESTHNSVLLKTINKKFGAPDYLVTRPIFSAVLALANRDPNADALVAKAESAPQLSNEQLAQLGQACARASKKDCALREADTLSAREGLNDADIAGIGEVYFIVGEYQKGLDYISAHRTAGNAEALDPTWAKLATVTGKTEEVSKWLESYLGSGKVDPQILRDLYFLSLEHNQHGLNVKVAEAMMEKFPTAENKNYLGIAYLRNGQYDAAIPMLRDARGESEASESAYISALAKAGKQNPEFKAELENYLTARLNDPKLPEKRKQQLLYVLIDQGRTDVAFPYIRSNALRYGGSWASLYENALVKQGRKAELRDYWLKVANNPNTPSKRRREIAFNLLNTGDKVSALPIFRSLAEHASADSPDVRQLLYLWGPRPSPEGIAWIERRANNSSGQEQALWLRHLSDVGADAAVLRVAQAHPDVLDNREASQAYLQSLGRSLDTSGDPKQLQAELEKRIPGENDPKTLRFYSALAEGHGLTKTSQMAYEKLYQIDPENADVNKHLGILAFNLADYSETKKYLPRFDANHKTPADDDYRAYFDLAESYNHDRQFDQARIYYAKALEESHRVKATSDNQSVAAQSTYHLGEVDKSYAMFDDLLAKDPNNRLLRADYASTLIEGKRYSKAQEIIAADTRSGAIISASTAPSQMLLLDNKATSDVAVSPGGREVLITLARPADKIPALKRLSRHTPDSLNYASVGYDQALLVASDNTRLDAEATKSGVLITSQSMPTLAQNSASLASQTDLRMELLSARIELETGHQNDATKRLAGLESRYPNDTQLMGYTANAEYYTGRWMHARELISQAHSQSPENEDVAILNRDIERVYGPQVRLDHEWRMIGDNDEQITTLSGQGYISPEWRIGVNLQNDYVDSVLLRRSDGRFGEFSEARQRGALFVNHDDAAGNHFQAAIYGNKDTAGAGLEYGFVSNAGITTFGLDYHRPYWDFVEAVLGDATRDRISVAHVARIDPTLTLSGSLGYNIYNVDVKDDVDQTVTFTFNAVKALQTAPFLALGYGLDAEYNTSSDTVTNGFGTYDPLPFPSREVHSLSVLGRYDFNDDTFVGGSLGYAYDRLGGDGPVGEAYINHYVTDDFEVGARAYKGLGVGDTNDDYTRIGANATLHF